MISGISHGKELMAVRPFPHACRESLTVISQLIDTHIAIRAVHHDGIPTGSISICHRLSQQLRGGHCAPSLVESLQQRQYVTILHTRYR